MRAGASLMFVGNLLVMALQFYDAEWKYFVYVIPANLGQGIVYPAILFTFLAAFGHDGMCYLTGPSDGERITNCAVDHAVSASTVYLIRSLGTVYGVAITSTIVQNELVRSLPEALRGVPNKWKVPLLPSLQPSTSSHLSTSLLPP